MRLWHRDQEPEAKPPLPRWLGWLLFAFLAYLIVVGNVHKMTPADSAQTAENQEIAAADKDASDYPAIRRAFDLHNWERGINPTFDKGLSVRDFTQGKGRPAACGDEATITLRGRDAKGNDFDPKRDESKPIQFMIGKGESYKALDEAVIGMRVGGERSADAPPALVLPASETAKNLGSIELRMNLTQLTPDYGDNASPLLVTQPGGGKGEGARCGETIHVAMRMWENTSEKPIRIDAKDMTLGKRDFAIGLDYALPGIKQGETRVMVLPEPYQQHDGNDSPFDGKHMRIVEVTRLEAVTPK